VRAVIHKEVASDIKFDVVALLLGLEKIKGHTVMNISTYQVGRCGKQLTTWVQDGLKLELTFDRLDGKMLLPERAILLRHNILGISSPEGLVLLRSLVSTSLT
jgi:hypothetical protein